MAKPSKAKQIIVLKAEAFTVEQAAKVAEESNAYVIVAKDVNDARVYDVKDVIIVSEGSFTPEDAQKLWQSFNNKVVLYLKNMDDFASMSIQELDDMIAGIKAAKQELEAKPKE
jgi:hypothetical protein